MSLCYGPESIILFFVLDNSWLPWVIGTLVYVSKKIEDSFFGIRYLYGLFDDYVSGLEHYKDNT